MDHDLVGEPRSQRVYFAEALFFRQALLSAVVDSSDIEWLGELSSNGLVRAWQAYARHDIATSRVALGAFASTWRETSGPVTPDIAYPEARLFASLGDTASAVVWLDRTLSQVGNYDPEALADNAVLASLIRTMILRAEIASRRSDVTNASRWATAVLALWSRADPDLQPAIAPLHRFARSR